MENPIVHDKKVIDKIIRQSAPQIIFDDSPEEIEFEKYIKLFLDGEISYEQLLSKYPDYDSSIIRKIIKRINNKLTKLLADLP